METLNQLRQDISQDVYLSSDSQEKGQRSKIKELLDKKLLCCTLHQQVQKLGDVPTKPPLKLLAGYGLIAVKMANFYRTK
ncbi:unnamed protein product [Timema podura]|uniref:Uncharacterized protein n=1 Tax=Timema podura TaxID=61482 RepID=A0ABN7NVX7_TIMPD|nr:unnamed protein product [Timema podura]